jgi:hypothetical protein
MATMYIPSEKIRPFHGSPVFFAVIRGADLFAAFLVKKRYSGYIGNRDTGTLWKELLLC